MRKFIRVIPVEDSMEQLNKKCKGTYFYTLLRESSGKQTS